jgi:hypothetical protein
MDNGNTWTPVRTGFTNPYVNALAASGTTLLAGASGVFRSTDNGANWTEINTGLAATGVNALAVRGTTLFAGSSGGAFRSTDNGNTWTNTGLTDTNVQTFAMSGMTLFAGTFGGFGVWKHGNILSAPDTETGGNLSLNQLICYPNPVHETLTVSRKGARAFNESAPVTYTVSNLLGAKEIRFDQQESNFSISVSTLATGMYVLSAQQGLERYSTVFSITR